MKIALVHDYLREYGGAERVLEVLHEIWPESPVYTAFVDWESLGLRRERFENWEIHTSWGQKLPAIKKLFSPYRIFAPTFFRSFDFSRFDVVISSSSVYFAKAIKVKPPAVHICYCHTPPRFLYGYPTAIEWQKHWWGKLGGSLLNHWLRMADWQVAQEVDFFIANSQETALRIKKFYRRDSVIIYPPVKLLTATGPAARQPQNLPTALTSAGPHFGAPRLTSPVATKPYYLCVSRLARSKRIDLAIEACNRLRLPLKVVGAGREEENLKVMAGLTVEFLGEVSDEELANLYFGCRALIFPAEEEDFGMVPVEAMSFGKPVIAYRSGGVVESVIEGKTGIFFNESTTESLMEAIKRFNDLNHDIKAEDCLRQAQKFSKERFKKEIKEFVEGKNLCQNFRK